MAAWTIGVEISGSKIDSAQLGRLVEFLKREFPDYETDCAMWSGFLAVDATVRSPTLPEALESALRAIDLAFDETGVDANRASEITNVTMRRVSPAPDSDSPDSLPHALLRRVSPVRHWSGPT
jgi:hypothetical protein